MLYWFRTPPDVQVGRLALDPEAIRSIEEANPGLKFDWDKILKVKPPPPPQEYDREAREERRAKRRRKAASEAEHAAASAAVAEKTDEEVPAEESPSTPMSDDEALAQWLTEGAEPEASSPSAQHVALAVTDEEGLARLRARYATIVARIGDRQREPDKLAALQEQAALIDPDAWRTEEEARERLATLDETTEALRRALGRRRRSRRGGARRRRRAPDSGAAPDASTKAAAEPASPETPPPSDDPSD